MVGQVSIGTLSLTGKGIGMGEFSIWHLIILLLIVVALFGTSKLRNAGSDLGAAIKGFRAAVKEEEKKKKNSSVARSVEDKLRSKNGQENDHQS